MTSEFYIPDQGPQFNDPEVDYLRIIEDAINQHRPTYNPESSNTTLANNSTNTTTTFYDTSQGDAMPSSTPLAKAYDPDTGIIRIYTYGDFISMGFMPPNVSNAEFYSDWMQDLYAPGTGFYSPGTSDAKMKSDFGIEDSADSSDGGGGGGARSGISSTVAPERPNYSKPDVRTIRDQIKSYVVATTGVANTTIIESAMKAYLDADKTRFENAVSNQMDNAGLDQIDPWASAQETVRNTQAYKSLHKMRPEFIDEMDWVSGRQAKLMQIGLSGRRAEDVGIGFAMAGASDEAMTLGAGVEQQRGTGRLLRSQREQLKQSANAALGLL